MLREIPFKRKLESVPEMALAGRAGQAVKVTYTTLRGKEHTQTIAAGQRDTVRVYRDDNVVYVLSFNFAFNYVGVEVFQDFKMLAACFWQHDWEIASTFGVESIEEIDEDQIIAIIADYIQATLD